MSKPVEKTEVELDTKEESLLDETQARLDSIFGDEEGEQAEQVSSTPENEPEDESEDKSKDEPEDESETEEEENQAEQTDSTPADEPETGKESTEEVSLSDAAYRAAIHQGWKPDEIKEFFEASPELAIRTFSKIQESTTKLSNDFANIGRAKMKSANKPADSQPADTAKKVDLDALKEEYGADSSVVKAIEALQASIPVNTIPSGVTTQAQPQDTQPALDPRVEVMVNQFFTSDALKPYEDFYGKGKDVNNLTLQQNKNRWAVLDKADEIIVGAAEMGRPVTVDEAMDMAHLLVSADVQKQAVRAELKAKIVKRSKGLSLKPAKNKGVAPAKDEKATAADLETKVQTKMEKIGLL